MITNVSESPLKTTEGHVIFTDLKSVKPLNQEQTAF